MTGSEILSQARVFARLSASGLSDTQAYTIIDQANQEVMADLNGVPARATVAIGAKFYLGAELYIRLTITGGADALSATDIQVTTATMSGASGTDVATELETNIQAAIGAGATTAVTWADFYFTITAPVGTTSITVEAPTGTAYGNAVSILFGSATATQTGVTWTGAFPRDCTIEADLPDDFHQMVGVTWNNFPMYQAPRTFFMDPKISGTRPYYWFMRNDKIQFFPVPTQQFVCNIWYSAVSTAGSLSTGTQSPILPARYHTLILYYVVYLFLSATHEYQSASVWYGRYRQERNQYIVNQANNVTTPESISQAIPWYTVRTT